MRTPMEYKIISGSVVEIRRTYLSRRNHARKPRGQRIAGNTSERKIRQNEVEKKKTLARLLNANLEKGWIFATFKFDDEHLPEDYSALKESGKKLSRAIREAFKAEHGRNPKMFLVNANWEPMKSGKGEGRPARYHHHVIMEAWSWDKLNELWSTEHGVSIEPIDGRKDHTALAVYLVDNVHGLEKGQCAWSTSRGNLNKPIFTEPTPVESVEDIEMIPTARQMEFERVDDEDGRCVSTYLRCILTCKPTIRGRQIILPVPPKRGGRKKKETGTERSL